MASSAPPHREPDRPHTVGPLPCEEEGAQHVNSWVMRCGRQPNCPQPDAKHQVGAPARRVSAILDEAAHVDAFAAHDRATHRRDDGVDGRLGDADN